jgi:dipeptidase
MCTSIAVGPVASRDGSLLVARNEDCARAGWNKALMRRPQPEWLAFPNSVSNGTWTLGNGMRVPVPPAAFAYTGMPDAGASQEATAAIGNRFFFEERGVNACNFAISATNSMTTNPAAAAADPFVEAGVAECILPTLLLPQARSARHALELIAGYMSVNGASEPNGFFLADLQEIWYVEIGSAHHWMAVRVPPDRYVAVANALRIHDVDLADADAVRHSEGLFEFVCAHQLLQQPDARRFDFAQAFGMLGEPYNVDRVWLAQHLLTPSLQQPVRQPQYPLFLAPDRRIGPEDVMSVLRATYAGTPLQGLADRPIGWRKTAESHVIVLDPKMPEALRGLLWQCVSTPLCAPYLPVFAALDRIPAVYANGSDTYGTNSAYWAYRGLFTLAETAGESTRDSVAAMWREHERRLVDQQRDLRGLLAGDAAAAPQDAVDIACRYSAGAVYEALEIARATRDRLMTELTQAA